jgi:hypothetical protein
MTNCLACFADIFARAALGCAKCIDQPTQIICASECCNGNHHSNLQKTVDDLRVVIDGNKEKYAESTRSSCWASPS